MKIALIILHADPSRGGAERYTSDLAASLAQRGHHVWLLASSFGEVPAGVGRVELPARAATRHARYQRFLSSLEAHIEREPYDILHAMLPVRRCHLYHPHAGIAAEAIAANHLKHTNPVAAGVAKLATRLNARRQAFARVERELLSSANPPVVLCLSDYVKAATRRHYRLPDERLFTLFNATNTARFDPMRLASQRAELRRRHGFSDHHVIALMIAQDFVRKGLKQSIEALKLVPDPRLRLLVVGKDDPAPYRRLASQLKVSERVVFAGPTTTPENFYAAADFFLLPTRHDPCSLVVLEALAMGLPVISTAQNGACEVMADGREGFVLPNPDDMETLAKRIVAMLDSAVRQRMSAAALKLRHALSQDVHVERLLTAYERARS